MELRPAGVEDAPGIAELHVASWRWAYAEVLPPAVLEGLRVEDRERMWLATSFPAAALWWPTRVVSSGSQASAPSRTVTGGS